MSDLSYALHELAKLPVAEKYRLAAPYITSAILLLTFWATIRLTRSQKATDTVIECGRAFNELMKAKWDVKNMRRHDNIADADWRAHRMESANFFYGQFFSFQFSEFVAYRSGFIDRQTFTLWMRSRRLQWANSQNETIHGIAYRDGWDHWVREWHHGAQDEFTRFMNAVHSGTDRIEDTVGSKAPLFSLSRTVWWIGSWLPFR